MPQFVLIRQVIDWLFFFFFVTPSLDSTMNVNVSSDMSATASSTINCVCNAQMNSNIISVSTQQCDSSQIASINSRSGRFSFIGSICYSFAESWERFRRIFFG